MTVLILDPNAPLRRRIAEHLETNGYRVLEAETSAAAAELCRHSNGMIDLMLVEAVLPGMPGIEFVKRAWLLGARAPVVFMTEDRDWLENARNCNLLRKPFSVHALLGKVAELVGAPGHSETPAERGASNRTKEASEYLHPSC